MTAFTATINVDNDAFQNIAGGPDAEVARVLRDLADKVEDGRPYVMSRIGTMSALRDVNGNTVGTAGYVDEDKS